MENTIKQAFNNEIDQNEFDYRANLIKNKIIINKCNKISFYDILSNIMLMKPQYAISMIVGIAIGFAANYQMTVDMELYNNVISAAIYGGEYYG